VSRGNTYFKPQECGLLQTSLQHGHTPWSNSQPFQPQALWGTNDREAKAPHQPGRRAELNLANGQSKRRENAKLAAVSILFAFKQQQDRSYHRVIQVGHWRSHSAAAALAPIRSGSCHSCAKAVEYEAVLACGACCWPTTSCASMTGGLLVDCFLECSRLSIRTRRVRMTIQFHSQHHPLPYHCKESVHCSFGITFGLASFSVS
jgi:hypothetical protein